MTKLKPFGSVLEATAVLGEVLRPHGYTLDTVSDLAVWDFLDYEQASIRAPASMHLLAIKKALLYATPVIAPSHRHIGIVLTSAVASPALRYDEGRVLAVALAPGDKFRLIGFAFPSRLVNLLRIDIFPWKHFNKIPLFYAPAPVDISRLDGIETHYDKRAGAFYLVKTGHYEDTKLFNAVDRIIANHLYPALIPPLLSASRPNVERRLHRPTIDRIPPFAQHEFLKALNAVLSRTIDATYSCALYEGLQKTTSGWGLYDQIRLYGFNSAEIGDQLRHLAYVKAQTRSVRKNSRAAARDRLVAARAERIARAYYPQYFDYTDHRAIFVNFNSFSLDKIPQGDRLTIKVLLDKSIAAQTALSSHRCEHVVYLRAFARSRGADDVQAFKDLMAYVDQSTAAEDGMYPCRMCEQPLVCEHEIALRAELTAQGGDGNDGGDNSYRAQRTIINRFAIANQRGDRDTEALYTYYCKYCGAELGKSIDVVQAGRITWANGSRQINEEERSLLTTISALVRTYARPSTIPISLRAVTSVLFDVSKQTLIKQLRRGNKNDGSSDNSLRTRYLCTIYTLAGLLALNVTKIKSSKSILNTTGSTASSQLKHEFVAAMKIVHANASFKRLGARLEKIKTALVAAFRTMNQALSKETVSLRRTSPRDRLEYDVRSSPIAKYAASIHARATRDAAKKRKTAEEDVLTILGVDLDALFSKKKMDRPKAEPLFKRIFLPDFISNPSTSERVRYIFESYVAAAKMAARPARIRSARDTEDPAGSTEDAPSAFSVAFEAKLREAALLLRTVPAWDLPGENSREHDFSLQVDQVAYCLAAENKPARAHRWNPTRSKSGETALVCRYCNLDIRKASKKHNASIQTVLREQMHRTAFFECYMLACPVKRAHVFELATQGSACKQCGVTQEQLKVEDTAFYDKYKSAYRERRRAVTAQLMITVQSLVELAPNSELPPRATPTSPAAQVDALRLESLLSSLAKLYSLVELEKVLEEADDPLCVDSYVQTFYTHYMYVKNLSMASAPHPDSDFFRFVREAFYDGARPRNVGSKLPSLPELSPLSSPRDRLTQIMQTAYDISMEAQADNNLLIKQVLSKIASQHSRREPFNRAKLRASMKAVVESGIGEDEDSRDGPAEDDEAEEDSLNMVEAFDIESDLEDNFEN